MKRLVAIVALMLVLLPGVASANTYRWDDAFGGLVDNRCPENFRLELFTKADFTGQRARVCAQESDFRTIVESGCTTYCENFDRTVSSYRWLGSWEWGTYLCLYEGLDFTGDKQRIGPWNGFPRSSVLSGWVWDNAFRSARLC